MKQRIIYLLILLLTSTTYCFAEKPINIVTTIGQITNITEIIGGEHVNVIGLMGAGVDPHLYKASESDVRKLNKADMILYNGLFLEAKMEDIFEQMKRSKKTAALGNYVPKDQLLDSINYPGHYDPHIWFNVPFWMKVTQGVVSELEEFDPEHAGDYQATWEKYKVELEQLHKYVQKRARELPKQQRVLVTAHDAFRYFGKAYGFEVVGLQGMSTEAEAGTKDVIEIAELIVKKKIKAIFIESSVPERNIRAVQDAVKARGWDVKIGGELFSDAMGDEGTFEGTYIGMVTHNIDTIVNALKE